MTIEVFEPGTAPIASSAEWGETSLELPAGLPFDDWETIGHTLARMEKSVLWWLGDWWRFGEREYGESAAQAAPTGYALSTIQNSAWVADRIPPSRRRETLTFSHFSVVAALEPEAADEMLDLAETEQLSTRKLAQAVRSAKSPPKTRQVPSDAPVSPVPPADDTTSLPALEAECARLRALVEPARNLLGLNRVGRMGMPLQQAMNRVQNALERIDLAR